MGTILGWLKEYNTLGRSTSLQNFIIDKLNNQFLNKMAYSQDDRQLVREFFKYYGIDTTKTSEEEPKFEVLNELDMGLLSPRVKYEKVIEEEPVLTEAYYITPEGERIEYYIRVYQKDGVKLIPGQIIQDTRDRKVYEFIGIPKANGDPVLLPYKEKPKRAKERKVEFKGMTVERAQEIFGQDFLGPEAIKKTFGFTPDNIPAILFTAQELERAKELDQMLILRVNQTPDGKPLTMEEMNKMLAAKIQTEKKGKILSNTDWYKNEDFFKKDTPRPSWVLVSKDVIPNSVSKNYLQQTEQIVDYLKTQVFKDSDPANIPVEYQEAIEEFDQKKAGIGAILTSNWPEAAKQLSELKITQLTRLSPVEAIYYWLMYLQTNDTRLMEGKYAWTSRCASGGRLVRVGGLGSGGASVNYWIPDSASDGLGVVFSRSL